MPGGAVNEKIQDEGRLAELGYTQELLRDWSWLHNFGAYFSIINVTTGITTLFAYGLNTGGPAVMTVGWIVVNLFSTWPLLPSRAHPPAASLRLIVDQRF